MIYTHIAQEINIKSPLEQLNDRSIPFC
jgi:hypothetical protein